VTDPERTRLFIVLATLAAALFLTGQPLTWKVLRHVVTIAHEGGHAVAALLARRKLAGIRLHSDTSGVTVSSGRRTGPGMIFTAAAGYPAPCLLGAGFAALIAAGQVRTMLWVAIALLLVLLTQIRNLFGVLTVAGTAAASFAAIWWGSAGVALTFACALTWLLLVGGGRAVLELQRTRSAQQRQGAAHLSTDADQLARLTHLPGLLWVGVFLLLAMASLAGSGWLLLRQTTRLLG
jgi:Peptidase M50B-like